MNDSILKKLAAKLTEGETAQEAEVPMEVLEEHFDVINAAKSHDSAHWNNHRSTPSSV